MALIALAAALGATAGSSDALVIKSAAVTHHPTKGDSFTIKGEFPDLAITDASQVVFALDRSRSELQPADMKHGKLKLTFKGLRGAPGLTQLVLDLKKRRFTAKGAGLLLGGLPNALTVHLDADAGRGCAFVPLEQTTKPPKPGARPKAIHFRLPRKVQATPCLSNGIVRTVPPAVVVATSTSVRFIAPNVAAGTSDLRLFAATASGAPIGVPLCTLVDDGGTPSGDLLAGDQTFTCTVTVAEATIGIRDFVVTGIRAGVALTSPVVGLRVVAASSDADVTTILDTQAAVRAIWEEEVVALGDTLSARLATIRRIAALAGVADVGLSPDGVDIFIVYESGHEGGLMLSPRGGTVTDTNVTAATGQDTTDTAPEDAGAPAPHPRGVTLTCPNNQPRTLVGSVQALLLSTSFFGAAGVGVDDGPVAKARLEASCLNIHVDTKRLTIPNLLTMTAYSTVILSTHGIPASDGPIGIATDETATLSLFYEGGVYHEYFVHDEAGIISVPKSELADGREVVYVTSQFLQHIPGRFDHGLVYASHCHSGDDAAEASELIAKGAETVFGYERSTSYRFSRITARSLFDDMAGKFLTAGQAYAHAGKIDPYPFRKDEVPAKLVIFGNHELSYVDAPKLTPPSSAIKTGETSDLTVTVDRAESCELTYDWSTSANAGTLSDDKGHDGESFTSTAPAVTYTTKPIGVGTDDIHVAVHAPDDDGEPAPVFGEACSVVDVAGCGDDIVQDDEDCDGTDDDACPGKCTVTCTCPVSKLHIVFDGQGTWSQQIPPGIGINQGFSASVEWHVVYELSLPGLEPNTMLHAGPGTTVTGNSAITGMMPCSGPIVVNTDHGPGPHPAEAQTPFLTPVTPSTRQAYRMAIDAMGGYDYRLCDGGYNIGVGPWPPGSPDLPQYGEPAPFFAVFSFDAQAFGKAPPHTQVIPVSTTAHAASDLIGTADVAWDGTITLTSER